jgi:hypothetical protein
MSGCSSEPLGAQQRDQQIGAECERDDEAEDGFGHGGARLEAVRRHGVEAEQAEHAKAEREIDEVKHRFLQQGENRT